MADHVAHEFSFKMASINYNLVSLYVHVYQGLSHYIIDVGYFGSLQSSPLNH